MLKIQPRKSKRNNTSGSMLHRAEKKSSISHCSKREQGGMMKMKKLLHPKVIKMIRKLCLILGQPKFCTKHTLKLTMEFSSMKKM